MAIEEARGTGAPGVHAALSLLEAIVARGPLTLSEIARELGVPKSTLHRVALVLEGRGWIRREREGRYALGIRAIGIGARASELPIVTAFRAAASGLLTRFDETICLAALDGDETVFIAIEETSQPVRLVTGVGSRTPAFASASGRVFLADWRPAAVVAEFAGRSLITPTGRRLTLDDLLASLAETSRRGFAEIDGDTAAGLWAASFPVRNGAGVVLAALTVCVPASRASAERRDAIVEAGAEAARGLSESVSWMPSYDAGARRST